jgi:diphthine methyl ester synthase
MLYMIGIGLNDVEDITVKGLNAVKKCKYVYLENYTSILQSTKQDLEEFYGKEVILASRDVVEKNAEKILKKAEKEDVAFLVVGEVFGATTHTDIFLRAKKKNIQIKVINNTSILNAVGVIGLELYKYGKTTSIVFPDNNWLPETPYDVIKQNKSQGLHTLCLLDIKTAEPTKEDILKDKNTAQEPKFMTVNQAIEVLLKIEDKRKEKIFTKDTFCIGVARIGRDDQKIVSGKASDLLKEDFGAPLHSLIIPGKLHFVEEEMLENY